MEFVVNLIRSPFSGSGEEVFFAPALRRVHDHFIPHPRNNYHPHIFHHRLLSLFSIMLVCVKFFTLSLLTFGPVLPALSAAITVENIISLTNQSRQTFQLSTLTENSLLDHAAQTKANDMLAKGYFSHNTPDGKTPWDFIQAAGYNYISAGENLAVNFIEAENVEQAWMNSPSHRANILNKDFEEIGIGIAQGAYENHTAIFVVQMFGTPMDQKFQAAPAPTPVQVAPVPAPAPAVAALVQEAVVPQLAILNANSNVDNNQVEVTAQIPDAVKVLVTNGQQSIMLAPQAQNYWKGDFPLADAMNKSQGLKLTAFDMNGHAVEQPLATFAGSTQDSFAFLGQVKGAQVNVLGYTFDPKFMENRIYLLFMAAMLTALVVAVGVKKHIQHLSLVANGSFVIMLAALLFWAG